jgi:hypothetical protein
MAAPSVVAEHVVRNAFFAGVGLDSSAWTSGASFPVDRWPVILSAPDPDLVLHEVFHVWYDRSGAPRPASTCEWSALRLARAWASVDGTPEGDAALEAERRSERRVRVALSVWGGASGAR